jgi:hypothetical protein
MILPAVFPYWPELFKPAKLSTMSNTTVKQTPCKPKHLTDVVRAKYFTVVGYQRPYAIVEGKWEEYKMYQEDELVGFVERTKSGFKVCRKLLGIDMEATFKFSDIKIY